MLKNIKRICIIGLYLHTLETKPKKCYCNVVNHFDHIASSTTERTSTVNIWTISFNVKLTGICQNVIWSTKRTACSAICSVSCGTSIRWLQREKTVLLYILKFNFKKTNWDNLSPSIFSPYLVSTSLSHLVVFGMLAPLIGIPSTSPQSYWHLHYLQIQSQNSLFLRWKHFWPLTISSVRFLIRHFYVDFSVENILLLLLLLECSSSSD